MAGVLAAEMETAALDANAALAGAQALSILTISDSLITGESTTAEERQNSFMDDGYRWLWRSCKHLRSFTCPYQSRETIKTTRRNKMENETESRILGATGMVGQRFISLSGGPSLVPGSDGGSQRPFCWKNVMRRRWETAGNDITHAGGGEKAGGHGRSGG